MMFATLCSCNITNFLQEDQYYVEEVKTVILNAGSESSEAELKTELEKFYRLKSTNKRKNYNYFKLRDKEDPGWIGRWRRNKRSEAPNLLDSAQVLNTVNDLQQYLRNKKGYHQATVEHRTTKLNKSRSSIITILVDTGPQYKINKLHHLTKDSTIDKIYSVIKKNSILKQGGPIDAFQMDLEKQRIVSAFQKGGYADFNLTDLEVSGDSTDLDNAWDIFITILPDPVKNNHTKFTIGEISVYTDYNKFHKEGGLQSEYQFDKTFYKSSEDFLVRPSTIDRKIYLKSYDRYNSENYNKTVRNLFSLGTYSFAKVTPVVSRQDSSIIDYKILLTPHNNKWVLDVGLEAFFSNISRINGNVIGIGFGAGIQDRNAFGGSETFESSIEAGVEFQPSGLGLNSLSLGFNNSIKIPTLTKPFNVLRPANKLGLIKDENMSILQNESSSSLNLGFNYLDILNYFRIYSINAGYGYDITLNKRNRITFNQIGVNYTNYLIPPDGDFDTIISNNAVLENSFQTSFFTGLLFKDLTYTYQTERARNRNNYGLISRLEFSGLEVYGLNQAYNALSGNNKIWRLSDGSDLEKMIKLELDGRWYAKSGPRTQLAARVRTGIAIPIGDDKTVSYIEQFFVGGPSSIRAWRPMHLGPGNFSNDEFYAPSDTTIFYQRGDIVLDFSLEYRFDLIWYLEGALFLDGGNIWTIRDDINRPESTFNGRFMESLALGYGYGFRFDFNYFLIRFDLGFKLKYPQKNPNNDSYWISPKGQRFGNFNIAVNYPF